MIYPGGVSGDFRPDGMSYAMCRKGSRPRGQGRGSHVALFSEDPTKSALNIQSVANST